MAKAGADLVGLNCFFDPFIMLECIKVMKEALDGQDLKPFLISQPLGFRDPDAGEQGPFSLPEYPYALEPRLITRIEAQCLKRFTKSLISTLFSGNLILKMRLFENIFKHCDLGGKICSCSLQSGNQIHWWMLRVRTLSYPSYC